jgi:hypothetical protein
MPAVTNALASGVSVFIFLKQCRLRRVANPRGAPGCSMLLTFW